MATPSIYGRLDIPSVALGGQDMDCPGVGSSVSEDLGC